MKFMSITYLPRTVFFFFSLLTFHFSFSQERISGIVLDEQKKALSLVNIVLTEANQNSFLQGTVTDEKGQFRIDVSDGQNHPVYKLTFSYVGYVTQTLVLEGKRSFENIEIRLEPDANLLDAVTVTGERELFTLKGSTLIADVENTFLSKSGRLDDLMNKLPFVSGSDQAYEVFGRGQATLYVNGRKLQDPSLLQTLMSEDIRRIEVVTNPGPKYDASVRAVIQIYTKPKQGEGIGGSIHSYTQQGRRFTDTENVSLKYRKNHWEWMGSVSYNGTRMKSYSQDQMMLFAEKFSQTISKVGIDYKTNIFNGSFGMNYNDGKKTNLGFTSTVNGGEYRNDVESPHVEHYSGDMLLLDVPMKGISKNRPKKWLTDLYYSTQLGKTKMVVVNDVLWGSRSNLFDYSEPDSDTQVATRGSMNYLMNSFLMDLTSPLMGGNLSYGLETTYSRDKQRFGFDEKNLDTHMQNSSIKREQLLFAGYLAYDRKWGIFSLNGGLRYEYFKIDY